MGIKHQNNPPQVTPIPQVPEGARPLSKSILVALMTYYECKQGPPRQCEGCELVGYAGIGKYGDICEVFTELDEALLNEGELEE